MAKVKAEAAAKAGYPIELIDDAFGESPALAKVLQKVTGAEKPRVFIVADTNVVQHTQGLGSKIGRYVNANGITLAAGPVVMAGSEKIKADGLHSAALVISALLAAKLQKDDCVIVLGGGAILDVTGYAVGQVLGGLKIVRMPTTPAAMMEAAYADYAAVDSKHIKNALRVPSVPAAVVVDRSFASGVMDGVWRSGYGAALRLGLIADAGLVKTLAKNADAYRKRDDAAFREVVAETVAVRRKKGGATFGVWAAHRLESASGYKVPNGYAATVGMILDIAYAAETGLLKAKDRDLAYEILRASGAYDGLAHSRHQLSQADTILEGLTDWASFGPEGGLVVPGGIGKKALVDSPDGDVYRKIMKNFLSSPAAQ